MPWTLSAFADESGGSTDEQLAGLKQGGVKFIDPRSVDGHNISVLPLDLAKTVARKYEAAGVKVSMFGSPIGKIDMADDLKIDLDKLEHLGKLKDVFGCDKVRIFSFYNKKAKLDHKKWQQGSIDRLRQLADLADRLGMVLYHENESEIFGDRAEDCMAIAEKLRGASFKMIYDFANYIRAEPDGWKTWQICKGATDCFHLKDQRSTGEHVPMGQAPETAAERILRDAKDSGWTGPCTIEPHLSHSKAVVATNVHGTGSMALKDMKPAQTFQVACDAAHEILKKVGAQYN